MRTNTLLEYVETPSSQPRGATTANTSEGTQAHPRYLAAAASITSSLSLILHFGASNVGLCAQRRLSVAPPPKSPGISTASTTACISSSLTWRWRRADNHGFAHTQCIPRLIDSRCLSEMSEWN
eukprot:scaffold3342_cov135-Isochrysis_galbana.AAC.3